MVSKTSFFNKTIFLKTLKRFFPWCICYSLILLAMIPVNTYINYNSYILAVTPTRRVSDLLYDAHGITPFVILCIFTACILSAILIYSFLYKDNAVSMFHSLPVKRSTLLFTSFLAGMTLLLIPLLLSQGITILIALCIGVNELALLHLKYLLGYLVVTFIFFTIATFCSLLAGNIVAVPIIYFIFNLIAYGLTFVLNILANFFLFGISTVNIGFLEYFTPIGYLYNNFSQTNPALELLAKSSDVELNITILSIYGVAALVLFLLSLLLYKKRALECAGDILAFKKTAWVFQIMFAIGTGLFTSAIIHEFIMNELVAPIVLIVAFVIGSFIGFAGCRMLIRKRFFVFKECIVGFCIFAVCSVGIMLFTEADILGFETRIPNRNEVGKVSVNYNGYFKEEDIIKDAISLHKQIVQNKTSIEKRCKDPDYKTDWIHFDYVLKNGKTLTRDYEIPFKPEAINDISSMIYRYYELMNHPLIVKSRYLCNGFQTEDLLRMDFVDNDTGDRTEIPLEQGILIVEALQQDIAEGNVLNEVYIPDYEMTGSSPYLESNYRQSQQVLELYIIEREYMEESILESFDLQAATSSTYPYDVEDDLYEGSRFVYLKNTMVHTLKVLDELGYVTEEKPLTYSEEY